MQLLSEQLQPIFASPASLVRLVKSLLQDEEPARCVGAVTD
jgi:hypothetical protein